MPKPIIEVKGIDGQLTLLADRIIISRKGLLNAFKHGINVSHEIPLASISGVDFREANFFKQGVIDFDHSGKQYGAAASKNAVLFNKKQQPEFFRLKEKIFQIIEANRRQNYS